MAIIVYSPFSGRPVKVREQDVGRAVRDDQGRIFYVLRKSDGSGYYGAPTRVGGPKDEARALEYEAKVSQAEEHVRAVAHDATGKRRSHLRGKLVILAFVILAAILIYLFKFGPFSNTHMPWQNPPPPPEVVSPEPSASPEAPPVPESDTASTPDAVEPPPTPEPVHPPAEVTE